MSRSTHLLSKITKNSCGALLSLLVYVATSDLAHADTTTSTSGRALQQALSATKSFSLYDTSSENGLKINSSYFSGDATGANIPDRFADFNTDQKLYALLVDGRYDFNYDTPAMSTSFRPYLMGSMGVAAVGRGTANNITSQNNAVTPLFRLGGGVSYRLDRRWDLSLDYKAGVAAASSSDYLFTGRSQQAVDLQALNFGMHYAF